MLHTYTVSYRVHVGPVHVCLFVLVVNLCSESTACIASSYSSTISVLVLGLVLQRKLMLYCEVVLQRKLLLYCEVVLQRKLLLCCEVVVKV